MIDLQTIREWASKNAKRAKRLRTKPLVIRMQEDLRKLYIPPFPLPFLGDYVPEGFYLKDEWFVDSSGFGLKNESAMTVTQFLEKLQELDKPFGLAVREAGQFQVYVGVYGVNELERFSDET